MRLFEQGHALVVGVGEYADADWNAPVTRHEAQAVAEALQDPYTAAYRPENVQSLFGSQATRGAILNGLKQIAVKSDRHSTVLLYFCGHGELTVDGSYAFAPHDAVFCDDERIERATGIAKQELQLWLQEIPARKVVCVINTCFAGHVGGSGLGKIARAQPVEAAVSEQEKAGEGLVVLTAGRATQASYYKDRHPYTLFGQAFIDGLRGKGVPNRDGYIDLMDLYREIYARVRSDAEAIYREQQPTLSIVSGVGDCPIARYPQLPAPFLEETGIVSATQHYWRSRGFTRHHRLVNQCGLLRSESQTNRTKRPLAFSNVPV